MANQQLKIVDDSRVALDEKTGVVRSFFGSELVHAPEDEKLFDEHAEDSDFKNEASDFLKVNDDYFKLANIAVEVDELRKGQATTSIRYQQWHGGLQVYGAELLVSMRKDGHVLSVVNNIDYSLSNQIPKDSKAVRVDVRSTVAELFGSMVHGFHIEMGPLFVYRHHKREQLPPPRNTSEDYKRVMKLATGDEGKVYIVQQAKVDTKTPSGNWELLVDTATGEVVSVFDRRSYLGPKAWIFEPDPITKSGDRDLNWTTPASVLDLQLVEAELEDLDPAGLDGNWFLNGKWVKCVDIEPARFPSPASINGEFKFRSKEYSFLFVMVYYWANRLINYLRGFGNPTFNSNVVGPFQMDPLGLEVDGLMGELAKTENSLFRVEADGAPCIVFGEGGVPDASDAHVIVHEYGHAMHHFLNSRQGCYEEGFCDFLAAAWLDRFNEKGLPREVVFPWDNNASILWDRDRRLDRHELFSDMGFDYLGQYLKGDTWGTALWDLFLNIGGNGDPKQRIAAVDAVIQMYMEMLLLVPCYSERLTLGNALMEADKAIHGYPGRYRQEIWDAFARRGLWTGNPPPLPN